VVVLAGIGVALFLLLGNDDEDQPVGTAGTGTASPSDEPSDPSEDPDADDPFPAGQPPGDFDDPEHDRLAEACHEGDWTACDDLYWGTSVGSAAEEYGGTCGGRNEFEGGGCEARYGDGGSGGGGFPVPEDLPDPEPAPTGNADFQEAADLCEDGQMLFCDILKLATLGGNDSSEAYGEYGLTCGGRNEPTETSCVELYG
jgi:hypothetical protein